MADPTEIVNPKKTLRRREEEAMDESPRPLMSRAKEAAAPPAKTVDFTRARKMTPEQQAESDRKLKEMLRRRGG